MQEVEEKLMTPKKANKFRALTSAEFEKLKSFFIFGSQNLIFPILIIFDII